VILFVLATFREINYNIRDGVNRAKDKYLSVTYDSDVLLNEKNRSKLILVHRIIIFRVSEHLSVYALSNRTIYLR